MKKGLILLPIAIFALSISACNKNQNNNNNNSGDQTQNAWTVAGVSLNYEKLTMYAGKSATLTAVITPETATNKEVSWSSSNTSVATVKNGTITAIKAGTSNITVTTKDGGYTATCELTVINEEDETPYVPDTSDSDIYQITTDNLSNGTYDSSKDEYTFSVSKNYKQIYVHLNHRHATDKNHQKDNGEEQGCCRQVLDTDK